MSKHNGEPPEAMATDTQTFKKPAETLSLHIKLRRLKPRFGSDLQ